MASWKLSLVVLLALTFVLASQVDSHRRHGRRRSRPDRGNGQVETGQHTDNDDAVGDTDVDNDMGPGGVSRGPGGRSRGPGGRSRGGPGGRSRGGRRPGRPGRGRGRGRRPHRPVRPNRRNRPDRPNRPGRRPLRPTGPGAEAQIRQLLMDYSMSNCHFGINVYKEMKTNADNFAISPLSIHSALSMILLGSGGVTKRELIRALHIRSPIHPAFKAYSESLDLGSGGDTTISMANALYTGTAFSPKMRYVNRLRAFYNSEVSNFDEDDRVGSINSWVAEKTNDLVTDFLSEGEVTENTIMLLVNAVYFKGLWKDAFDEDQTSMATFTDASSDTHDVYMMKRDGNYRMHHSDVLGATALKMPYKGERYSFNIILPDEGTELDTVESRLTHTSLNETLHILTTSYAAKVSLEIPKFSMDTEQDMETLLRSLGINSMFEPHANFRRMAANRNMGIDKVKHRCIVEVDETGTEAAGVTGGMMTTSLPAPFKVNRPFMYILRDDQRSINLFMGRYANPQGDNMM